MRSLILIVLFGCCYSAPQDFGSFGHGGGGGGGGHGQYDGGKFGGGGSSIGGYPNTPKPGGHTTRRPGGPAGKCPPGQVPHAGSCVTPEVKQWLFVYGPPKTTTTVGPPPNIPKPKINYNVVLVHSPEHPKGQDPIVVPPPQQKTVVYVLTKNGQEGQQIIEIPAGPKDPPKVFYVNYNEGENPSLPGGITLEDALNMAIPKDSDTIHGEDNDDQFGDAYGKTGGGSGGDETEGTGGTGGGSWDGSSGGGGDGGGGGGGYSLSK